MYIKIYLDNNISCDCINSLKDSLYLLNNPLNIKLKGNTINGTIQIPQYLLNRIIVSY